MNLYVTTGYSGVLHSLEYTDLQSAFEVLLVLVVHMGKNITVLPLNKSTDVPLASSASNGKKNE